jgi:hypothetical protein
MRRASAPKPPALTFSTTQFAASPAPKSAGAAAPTSASTTPVKPCAILRRERTL